MKERVWIILVTDPTTGVVMQGSLHADSEIEARQRITQTLERMFMGSQPVGFDRTPELLSDHIEMLHVLIENFDPESGPAYWIGRD